MTQMQPDPSSEFREELDFRSKVYRMLSLGLSTTEVESLLQKKIDWTLFSENTVQKMMDLSTVVNVPEEVVSALYVFKKDVIKSAKEECYAVRAAMRKQIKLHKEFMDFVLGWLVILSFCSAAVFLIGVFHLL